MKNSCVLIVEYDTDDMPQLSPSFDMDIIHMLMGMKGITNARTTKYSYQMERAASELKSQLERFLEVNNGDV